MRDPFSPHDIPDGSLVTLVNDVRSRLPPISTNWPNTDCPLANVGEYLVRCTESLAALAEKLAHGEHIRTYATQTVDKDSETEYSKLDEVVEVFDMTQACLEGIASQIQAVATNVRSRLKSVKPPIESLPVIPLRTSDLHGPASRPQLLHSHSNSPRESEIIFTASESKTAPTYSPFSHGHYRDQTTYLAPHVPPSLSASPVSTAASDDAIQDRINQLLEDDALKARGTGNHECPWGLDCKKGGVENDRIKIFHQNSAFRAHLQKHHKPYKCDLPGCTNTKGFARKDQLKRHQRTTKHLVGLD